MAGPYVDPRDDPGPHHYITSSAGPSTYGQGRSSGDAYYMTAIPRDRNGSQQDRGMDSINHVAGDDGGRRGSLAHRADILRYDPSYPRRRRNSPEPHEYQSSSPQLDPNPSTRHDLPTPRSDVSLDRGLANREGGPSPTSIPSKNSPGKIWRAPTPTTVYQRPRVETDAVGTGHGKDGALAHLGLGPAPKGNVEGRRAVTEPFIDTVSTIVLPIYCTAEILLGCL